MMHDWLYMRESVLVGLSSCIAGNLKAMSISRLANMF
jgi:hypothetical protein